MLIRYYRQGFTYIEVGDGDEMWKNRRFGDIVNAHPRTFDLLHRFNRENRLHLIAGNHDIGSRQFKQVLKDGLIAEEGLVLRHTATGQRLFVVHGHQMEKRIISWSQVHRQVVIVGHTHRPMAPHHGAWLYFNTGSCTVPGTLTGLELQDGELRLVKWIARPETNGGRGARVERQLLAPAHQLRHLRSRHNGQAPG